MAEHLRSVRNHVNELGRKSYQESVLGSPDFVIMFIPVSYTHLFGEYNALKERLAYEVHEWEKLGYELELLEDRLKEML